MSYLSEQFSHLIELNFQLKAGYFYDHNKNETDFLENKKADF